MAKNRKIKLVLAAASFVMAAVGSKVSLAYWASAVIGSNGNSTGTVTSGTWDRYTTGTPISTCAGLQTMLQSAVPSGTSYHLTTNLTCSTTNYLGTTLRTFSGNFYGNGYTISGITNTNGRVGLFTTLSGATIRNLILSGLSFSSITSGPGGLLAGTNTGTSASTITRVRIYNSTLSASNANGSGGLIGRATGPANISDIMLQGVTISNTSTTNTTGAGGIIGKMSRVVSISDVYVEGAISSRYNSGGIVGYIENSTGSLTVNRAITYANASIRATTQYAGGVVGRNAETATQTLTDVFYTGAIYGASSRAGTIYNATAMTYSNAWAAQWSWDNTPTILYTAMTGTSANYTTNYVAFRTSLTTSWWSTSLPNIANSGYWTYDATTYLYELKPKV